MRRSTNYHGMLNTAGELNYEKQHKRVQPSGITSFTSSNTFAQFRIPGKQSKTNLDGSSMYILARFACSVANTALTKYGVLSAISRIEVESDGVKMIDVDRYHVLNRIKAIESSDRWFRAADGRILHGCSPDSYLVSTEVASPDVNIALTEAGHVYVIPLSWLGLDAMVPLWGTSGLTLTVHWASAYDYVQETTTENLTASDVAITEVSLNYDATKYSDEAFMNIVKNFPIMKIERPTYVHTSRAVVSANNVSISLGIGRTKTKKIYCCFRPNAAAVHAASAEDRLAMNMGLIINSTLELAGRTLTNKILSFSTAATGTAAEILLLTRKAMGLSIHSKKALDHNYTTYNLNATSSNTVAASSFYWCFDLTDGMETSESVSGLNLKGSSGEFVLSVEASGAGITGTLDVFAEYENMIIFDQGMFVSVN